MKHANFSKIVLVCVYVCVCVLSSCRPDTVCRQDTKVGLVCELRYPYYDSNRQLQVASTWDSLTVIGLNEVEPLYDNEKKIRQISLPMHVNADSTEYALLYRKKYDTICVYHTNDPEYISLECGCAVRHRIISIRHTHNWIDSIAVKKDSMLRSGETNIEFWNMYYVR